MRVDWKCCTHKHTIYTVLIDILSLLPSLPFQAS